MRQAWKWMACLLVWCVVGVAEARVKLVKPGQTPSLKPDEGLLVVAYQVSSSMREIRFLKDGKPFPEGSITQMHPGDAPRLYIVPAGEYTWEHAATFFAISYTLGDDASRRFTVKPGVINYPGHFLMRDTYTRTASFMMFNRGVRALDWLEQTHPKLHRTLPFAYTGRYHDPFPEWYAALQASSGKGSKALAATRDAPVPGPLPLDVQTLWRAPAIQSADLNGRGDLMVVLRDAGDQYVLDVVETATGHRTPMLSTTRAFDTLAWAGDDVYITISRTSARQAAFIDVFRFRRRESGTLAFEHVKRDIVAIWAEVLRHDPNHLLLGTISPTGDLQVHRVNVSTQAALDAFKPEAGTRINHGVPHDQAWFADGMGNLRLAVGSADGAEDGRALYHGRDGTFREVLRLAGDDAFVPLALTPDGERVIGLSDAGREQRDLVVFDPAQGKIIETLFSRPGVDVANAIFDDVDGRVIGAMYYALGHPVHHYFDPAAGRTADTVVERHPGRVVVGLDRARNGDMLFSIESVASPGGVYRYDAAADAVTLVEAARPWLQGMSFRDAEVLHVKAPDGYTLEAYLTRPTHPGPRPLVVLAHGGPIGVRDVRGFDPEVQLMAAMGYAVLQVNFRGSDGFGTQFRQSALGGYGAGIEDDIDAVLQVVMKDARIDASRMCAVGTSYGGYSALIASIRWPQRYRCAVSVAGVSDRFLTFTASDSSHSVATRRWMEQAMGRPDADADLLRSRSPLYRHAELTTPVMLVHGTDDLRVEYEHSLRLVRALNTSGRTPVLVTLERGGHGVGSMEEAVKAWGGIAGFLRKHLDGAAPPAPAAAATPAAAPAAPGGERAGAGR